MKESDALELIEDHLDGNLDLDPEKEKQLAEWLRENPEHADRAFQRIMLHVLLTRKGNPNDQQLSGGGLTLLEGKTNPPTRSRWGSGLWLFSGIVAAALLSIALWNAAFTPDRAVDQNVSQSSKLNLIPRSSAQAVWLSGPPTDDFAQWPSEEPLALQTGFSETRLTSSSTLLLMGPVTVERQSESSLLLEEGSLGLRWVPDSTHTPLKIETAEATFTFDRASRLGIRALPEAGTIVDVLSGEVLLQLKAPASDIHETNLLAGQSVWIDQGSLFVMDADWIERNMGPVRAALTLPLAQPLEVPWVYEGFDYAESIFKSQTEHPGLAFHQGGFGWKSPWSEQGNLVASIERAPLKWSHADDQRALGELAYKDADGNVLQTEGGQLRTSYGAHSFTTRAIDLVRLPQDVVDDEGLGADGTELWMSFLAQSYDSQSEHRYAFLQAFHRKEGALRLGKLEENENWASEFRVEDVDESQVAASNLSTGKVAFFVVRINFQPGNEHVHVWLNPGLQSPPVDDDATFDLEIADFRIREIAIHSRYSTDFDEIRLGPSFHSVAPSQAD